MRRVIRQRTATWPKAKTCRAGGGVEDAAAADDEDSSGHQKPDCFAGCQPASLLAV
jgi:hypothetical protein